MSIKTRSKVSRGTLEREELLQVQAEKVEMTLNTDSAVAQGLLIQRLTELYEDPVEASVRETVSNGLDAVVEAHSGTHPEIHITIPTTLNPIFTVKDNGVGMTYDDLKEIYSKYGASTKMNNFDQIGAYGLGAKAPLAYGTEFTVSSVSEGELTTIIVVREELTNYIKIVESGPTDAPSGTTVSIPVNSSDINRFTDYINRYRINPVDKPGVKMFISGEEITESAFMQISEDVVIFDNGAEKVKGRLWIKKDAHQLVKMLGNISEDEVRRSIEYLIGGWSYSNPTTRNRYNSSNGIMVELKSGIVSFNSARDAILENDRYNTLEELVVDYIKSPQFVKELITAVNSLDLAMFKSVATSLLGNNTRNGNLSIVDGEIKLNNSSSYNNSYNSAIKRSYSTSDLVHEETGFTLNDIFLGVPSDKKQTVALLEELTRYKKSVDNYMMIEKDDNSHTPFTSRNSTFVIDELESVMTGGKRSKSLESLILNIVLDAYNERNKDQMLITFITDVDADDNEKDFSRVRTGRKAITKMRNVKTKFDAYRSYVIYTEHTKADIEKMVEAAGLNSLDVSVESTGDMIEKLSEYRKANRTATVRTANQNLQTSLRQYEEGSHPVRVSVSDIDPTKENVIIIAKEETTRIKGYKMMMAWYCNENGVKSTDVNMYFSSGNHRKSDLEILKDLGELYENPESRYAGNSMLYTDLLKDRLAEMHAINNQDGEIEKKSFIRLLTTVSNDSPSSTFERLVEMLLNHKQIAEVVNVEMPTLDIKKLDDLGELGNLEFGSSRSSWDWRANKDTVQQLINNVNEDHYELIEDISLYYGYGTRLTIGEGTHDVISITEGTVQAPRLYDVELAYDESNENSRYHKMMRGRIESYLEFTKYIIEGLNELELN